MINKKYSWLLILIVLALLSAAFQFYSPKVFDPDAFYHITHANLYRAEGLSFSEFPWTQFSVIKNLKADIWYGFHLLLIPFTLLDGIFGVKFAAFLLTTAVLFSFYVLLKRLGLKWPFFWVLLFFFFIPDTHYRLLLLRPHLISFILSVAVFYFALNKKYWPLVLASAGVSFTHLALSWLPVLIVFAVLITDSYFSKRFKAKSALAVLAGLIAGILIRPNFWGGLKIAYVQVVDLMFAKLNNVPMRFGSELKPASNLSIFSHEILPLMAVFAVGLAVLYFAVKRKKLDDLNIENKTAVLSSFALSIIFGLMTVFVARRAIDLWVGFTFVFTGLSLSFWAQQYWGRFFLKNRPILIAGGFILALAILANTLYYSVFKYPRQVPDHRVIKPAAEWLKNNSQEGDIVFHAFWDNFSTLFFYNQKNRYLNGMDPIFLNSFNPSLNIKLYFFAIDKILFVDGEAYTCGSNPCAPGSVVTVYDAVKKDFRAKYVFVEPRRNPRFYDYLKKEGRFKETFSSAYASVFEVL